MVALALVRISILAFYLRIFVSQTFRYQAWGLMALITFALTFILQCNPLSFAWNRWDGEHTGTCIHLNAMAWAAAGSNIALDLCTIILPLPQIAKLQLSWGKKIPLMMVFCLGFLSVRCA